MSPRAKGLRPGRCVYCGGVAVGGLSCSVCRELEQLDPLAGQMRGPLSEEELGLEIAWPEGEPGEEAG